MNPIADAVQVPRATFVASRAFGAMLLLVLAFGITACSDDNGPVQPPTQAAAESDLSPRTPVPTAPVDACKVLTKEEVGAAIGKPMEQSTSSQSGRCAYQGDAEYLSVVVYAGMTEDDARKLYNSKYVNPSIIVANNMNQFATDRKIDNLGDEALIASSPYQRAGAFRVIYVRKGNQLFYILWLTSVTDRDPAQVLTELAAKIIPRL